MYFFIKLGRDVNPGERMEPIDFGGQRSRSHLTRMEISCEPNTDLAKSYWFWRSQFKGEGRDGYHWQMWGARGCYALCCYICKNGKVLGIFMPGPERSDGSILCLSCFHIQLKIVNSNSLNSNFRITRVFLPVPTFFLHKVTKFTSDNSRSDNSRFRLTRGGFPVPRH